MPFRQLGREGRQRATVADSHVQCEITPLDVPRRSEHLAKPIEVAPEDGVVRARIEHADAVDFPRRLRLGGERRGEQATYQGPDERPPVHHSITWSARCRSDWGIVRPRVLAV